MSALLLLLGAFSAFAQAVEPSMSLEEAVNQVQQETQGKILSASTVRRGRNAFEHRIKVLTPNGHVRVVTVNTDAAKSPSSPDSTKNPAGNGEGNKEKH
ncbi:PepSY domain-containing protein [Dyella terrae]|uniref:PepSY domain-containing protein n=1 Tax=Dyella terrae TaxID=522259 RepID=UPI001F0DF86F|nr:hypothetical protein [Dyella terrae]